MKIERYKQLYEFFITPTIKYTYDKLLFGHYCVNVIWGSWGFSVSWGHKKEYTFIPNGKTSRTQSDMVDVIIGVNGKRRKYK
jgi:hypothetical protein